jgi:hypothetical protein
MECSIENCSRNREKRGFCGPHYKRWLRHGDPLAGGPSPVPGGAICGIGDCGKRAKRRGLCPKHWERQAAGKDPAAPSWHDLTDEERFWPKVDKNGPIPRERPDLGPCWVWIAGKTGSGYGAFGIGHTEIDLAHRWCYRLLVGPIPDGLEIDHLCRNRACVRPDHLEPVPHRTNILRSPITPATINAGKAYCDHDHEFTPENTRIKKDGTRECKECRREITRRYRARQQQPPRLTADEKAELCEWVASGRAIALREGAGLRLEDAARDLSAGSKSTVGRWETGVAFPRRDYAVRYYRFLSDLGRQQAA